MILLIISFIAGILTVLAPCIFPVLPVIIGGSISETGDKRRPYVIIGTLGISIVIFTLLLKASTILINIPQTFWTSFSSAIILLIALSMIFPSAWEIFSGKFKFSEKSNAALGFGFKRRNLFGDITIGAALGPVFSSCSPTYFVILATVLPASYILGIIYLIAYAAGLSAMLLLVTFWGQKFVSRMQWAVDPRGGFKKIIGVLFLLTAIFIFFGYDKKLQAYVLDQGFFDITRLEIYLTGKIDSCEMGVCEVEENENVNVKNGIAPTREAVGVPTPAAQSVGNKSQYKNYIEIVRPSGFVNSPPFKLADFIGKKVILLDIMTYSCINCQRTFPYLNSWYTKYNSDGLVIIGIHTPEFAFERNIENVQKAMKDFGIEFPVVLDNDYATWNAYGNRYWPRKYLIDIDGKIVYDHIGEGEYEKTERKIQELLAEKKVRDGESAVSIEKNISTPENILGDTSNIRSPETYFGSLRNERLSNGQAGKLGTQDFMRPSIASLNMLYLVGKWGISQEYAESLTDSGSIIFKYNAGRVFLVAEAADPVTLSILIDGKESGSLIINEAKLYEITKHSPAEHILELIPSSAGLKAYAFTFGS